MPSIPLHGSDSPSTERSIETDALHCPTCGPIAQEQHPDRPGITRCSNCKEWLPGEPASEALFEAVAAKIPTPELLHDGPLAQVWCGDAMTVLPTMETESLGLVVTDPPYGVNWQSGFRGEAFDRLVGDGAGDRDVVRAVLAQCVRLVTQKRHLYVFGPTDVLEGLKVSEAVSLVWDKKRVGMGNLAAPWGPAHEPIAFCVSLHRHAGQAGRSTPPARVRKGTVLRFAPPTGRKVRHPSEKPVALLRELIESSSRQGETVLDPFAGIGSTGVAAVLSGRRAVLVEIDSTYAGMAVERIKQAERIAAMGEVA